MEWHEIVEEMGKLSIPFALCHDKELGWSMSIRGYLRSMNGKSPKEAVIKALVSDCFCNSMAK